MSDVTSVQNVDNFTADYIIEHADPTEGED